MDRHRSDRPWGALPARTAGVVCLLLVVVGGTVAAPPLLAADDRAGSGDAPPRERWPAVIDVAGEQAPTGQVDVTVTYGTGPDARGEFTDADVAPALVDPADDWAYLSRSALPPALDDAAGDPGVGVVAVGEWALVGDLAAATERAGRTEITVVAPAGVDVDPGRKAYFLAEFVSPYAFDAAAGTNATDRVTLVVAPDALPADGRTYGDTGYVTQHAFWDGDVGSVWIHEYVHTRQRFALAPEMRWFAEGSATYLSYRVMEEQYEGVSEADVRQRLAARAGHAGTALANRSAWDGSHADYHRGARLLYAVDAAVREGSDGEHTLVDVFRALNRHDGPVTVDAFVRVVERHSGEEETWLRAAITEPGDLDERVADAGDAFEE